MDIEDTLEAYYKALNCDLIDIVVATVDGREFDIVCDDEALLKNDPIPSACDFDGNAMIYGSILLLHHDDEGNLTEISEDDVRLLKRNTLEALTRDFTGEYTNIHILNKTEIQ